MNNNQIYNNNNDKNICSDTIFVVYPDVSRNPPKAEMSNY